MSAFERCFHCTEDVDQPGRWQIAFDGKARDVCCAGCEAVGNTIIAAGLDDYYRFRTEPAAFGLVPQSIVDSVDSAFSPGTDVPVDVLDQWSGWDAPEFAERYLQPVKAASGQTMTGQTGGGQAVGGEAAGSLCELGLTVEGLRCGACVWLLERSLQALPGVDEVRVNYATERARVRFDPNVLPLSALLRRGAGVGYQIAPFDAAAREVAETRQLRVERQRLFVAGLGAMQVMMYALPAYLAPEADIETRFVDLLRWASLVLTVPVMVYAAQPFLVGAWRDVRARSLGMDVPVAIGLLVAFSASVVNTVRGGGDVWFDSVSMFVFLLLGARALEASARRRARRALDALGAALPDMATRLLGGAELALSPSSGTLATEQVPAVRLEPGDLVRVAAGERVPADGRVVGEPAAVDLSLLTGESVPVVRSAGEVIPGGAIVAATPVTLEVTHAARDSTLSLLSDLVERGSAERPAVARLADRVARVFIATLLVLVAVVFVVWWQIAPERAAEIAIATLIVSCPCALSMATPAALAAATGRLTRARLLVTRGHTLESVADITDVVFDKTGTLTEGRPRVTEVLVADGVTEVAALQAAAQLEVGAAHPFARALQEASEALGSYPARTLEPPHQVEHVTGHGLVARSETEEWRLGSAAWCGMDQMAVDAWRGRSHSTIASSEVFMTRRWLAGSVRQVEGQLDCIARIALVDPLRAEATAVLQSLRERGVNLHLFSGDRDEVVRAVAQELDITDARAGLSPEGKQAGVAALQASGARVLMVGDGLNDAPVMATADVSLAIGQASDLARSAADAVALGTAAGPAPGNSTEQKASLSAGALSDVERLLATGRDTRRVIRQNLTWAAGYNLIMIPLTAVGLIPPWGAAIGMAGSSLLVSANALRLLGTGR
jgi:Cu2+-exporting ATPase